MGPDPEFLVMGFRLPFARNSEQYTKMLVTDMLLANGVAGRIDINLEQKQQVTFATSYPYLLNDYSMHMFEGEAKSGQTLEEVKNLILEEIDKLKNGQFDETLLKAVVMDMKRKQWEMLRHNEKRTELLVEAFAYDIEWRQRIAEIEKMDSHIKEDIIY